MPQASQGMDATPLRPGTSLKKRQTGSQQNNPPKNTLVRTGRWPRRHAVPASWQLKSWLSLNMPDETPRFTRATDSLANMQVCSMLKETCLMRACYRSSTASVQGLSAAVPQHDRRPIRGDPGDRLPGIARPDPRE